MCQIEYTVLTDMIETKIYPANFVAHQMAAQQWVGAYQLRSADLIDVHCSFLCEPVLITSGQSVFSYRGIQSYGDEGKLGRASLFFVGDDSFI